LPQDDFSIRLVQSIPISDVGIYEMIDLAGVPSLSESRIKHETPLDPVESSPGILCALGRWFGRTTEMSMSADQEIPLECLEHLIESYSYCGPGKVPANKVTLADLLKDSENARIARIISEENDPETCQQKYLHFKKHEIPMFRSFIDKHLRPSKNQNFCCYPEKIRPRGCHQISGRYFPQV